MIINNKLDEIVQLKMNVDSYPSFFLGIGIDEYQMSGRQIQGPRRRFTVVVAIQHPHILDLSAAARTKQKKQSETLWNIQHVFRAKENSCHSDFQHD